MPVKRRPAKARITNLSDLAFRFFMDEPIADDEKQGFSWYALEWGGEGMLPRYRPAYMWEQHRDELLEEFAEQHPGQRPKYWWTHDAPEPRRKVREGTDPLKPLVIESQASYLKRCGLLLPGEERRLAKVARAREHEAGQSEVDRTN